MPNDTPPDWAARFANDCAYAEKVLLESSALFQMCIAHTRDGRIVPVIDGITTNSECFHTMVRLVCQAYDAIGLSYMGEAWVARMDASGLKDYASGESPELAARPDRVEAVSVSLTYRLASGERQTMASLRAIERDASGKVVRLGDEFATPGWQPEGAVIDLLPDTVTEQERASAMETLEHLARSGAVKFSVISAKPDDDGKPAEST